MGFENYISESEAANFAGVSVATLNRFAEAGYLEIETETDGLRLFSTRELGEVFGIRQDAFTQPKKSFSTPDATLRSRQQIRANQESKIKAEPVAPKKDISAAEEEAPSTTSYYSTASEQNNKFVREDPRELTARMSSAIESSLAAKQAERAESVENDSKTTQQSLGAIFEETITPTISATPEDTPPLEAPINVEQAQRITTLERVVEMQEKILDMREKEIESLQKERDWLRGRIERLEEKGDRDQLLLLSETQVIRQLITTQKRSSPIRQALEWLGFVEPQKDVPLGGQAIEMKK